MKKRLLSAALALAMALTLLPMSVFATIAAPGTEAAKATESAPASGYTTVQYVYGTDYSKLDKDGNPIANAWAWQWTDTAGTYGTLNKTYWASKADLGGVVNGTSASGTWYADVTDLVNTTPTIPTLRTSSFTLVGNIDLSSISAKPTSLSVNTFGHNLTLPDLSLVNSITITDTFYTQYGGARGTVSGLSRNVGSYNTPAPNPATMSTSGLTLSITGAAVTGGISLTGRGNRVTLTDVAVTGNIVLDGTTAVTNTPTTGSPTTTRTYLGQSLTINPKATVPYTKSTVDGTISVTGNSNTVALNGVTGPSGATGAVTMTGVGGTLTASNGSFLGAITVATGSNTTTNPTLTLASAPATVTINDATVSGITYDKAAPTYTGASTFTVNAQGRVTGAISTENGTVNVNSANVSDVTVEAGTLNVSGSNGTVGDITLGVSGTATKVSFNFSGTNYKVGDIAKVDNATNLTIGTAWPANRTNTFGTLTLGNYTGQGIKGGIFGTAATTAAMAAWFSPDLQFFRTDSGLHSYYGKQELATAIADAGSAAATADTICVIGYLGAGTATKKQAEFYNSMVDVSDKTDAVALLTYGASTAIYLPNMINGTPVSTWTDASTVNTPTTGTAKTYGVNELVSLSSESTGVKLVIQSSGAAVTKLTNATAADPNQNITVTLTNNQITLSGAVGQASFEDVKVTCTTDLIGTNGAPVTFPVVVSFDTTTKVATISTLGINPPPLGVIINTSNNTIQVGNNTYTLSVSGLTKPASNLKVAGITSGAYADNSGLTGKTIVATVSASMGTAAKQTLTDAITGSGAEFDWTDSPAMQQVVNQAMTTITTNNQIENWATAAQRAAWNLNNKGKTPTESELYATGYTTVVVEPYLAMNITAFNQSGAMTATLVPSYRVLVVSTESDYIGANGVAKNKPNFTAEGYYIAQQGRALGNPITDLTKADGTGGVTIKFATGSATATGFSASTYMHQDSTYVYGTTDGITFELTRAGKTGLGTVVLNTTPALVKLERAAGATNVTNGKAGTYYYDNLQAAVDDTLPQATETNQDKITVTAAYTGSGTIDVTGTARVFKIVTEGQTTITNANNNFTVGVDATGHNFTVQLQQSVAAATGEVEVAVNTANNGYATPNANKAKAGDKVTVSVVPNTGYQGVVTAKTNTGASVPVTNNGNNTFTFTVPAGATRVDVTPVFTASSTLPFTDVATTDSFYNAVKWNYDNKYIQGTTTTTFRPYNYLTRGQIVLILYRNANSPTVNVSSYPYNDMPTYDAEMCRAIVWATNNKIVEGYGDGRFGPGLNVRNQEMAKILYEYNRYRGKTSTTPTVNLSTYFTDASSISSWAVPYVQWAVGNGVMGATSGKLFQPQLQLQRYQAAVNVYNYGLRFGA